MSDMELDKLGRITHPMILREDSDRYEEIDWDDAFSIISEARQELNDPRGIYMYCAECLL